MPLLTKIARNVLATPSTAFEFEHASAAIITKKVKLSLAGVHFQIVIKVLFTLDEMTN